VSNYNGMTIKQNLVSSDKWNIKCPYSMTAECFVIHNTANDASASNEIKYMIGNDEYVSFHYAIDDIEIVQGVLESRNAFHAGDGANGKGNRKGISIEICYSKGGGTKFTKAEQLAVKFLAYKLIDFGWDISKVTKHQDYSGKYCPHRTLDLGWQRFLNMIKKEMELIVLAEVKRYTNFKDVPVFYQTYITKWVDKGFIKGNEDGTLYFTEDMIRCLIIAERMQGK